MPKIGVHPADAPVPAGPYSPAVIAGSFVFVSGMTAKKPGSKEMVTGDIATQTRVALTNIKNILAAAGCTMDDVVKTSVHLKEIKDFAGFNEAYREFFTEPFPARTTVQSVLPGDGLVEIECIAMKPEGK